MTIRDFFKRLTRILGIFSIISLPEGRERDTETLSAGEAPSHQDHVKMK